MDLEFDGCMEVHWNVQHDYADWETFVSRKDAYVMSDIRSTEVSKRCSFSPDFYLENVDTTSWGEEQK